MFNQIFVSYLTGKNTVSKEQAKEVLEVQKNTRIRIGVLAVEEKLMTPEQVEQVNGLQASKNMRFGDIAVDEGYLTKEQLGSLLTKQPREHIILKQILCDRKYIDSEKFDTALNDFKSELGVCGGEFEKLLDNDIAAYISHIGKIDCNDLILSEYTKLFTAYIIRFIDRDVFVKEAVKINIKPGIYKFAVGQNVTGGASVTLMFASDELNAAQKFAETYAKFTFDDEATREEDTQDAVKEFLNCVSGLLISELSNSGKMELDLKVPEYYPSGELSFGETVVLPLSVSAGDFYVFVRNN